MLRHHIGVKFVVNSLPCTGYSGFPSSQKPTFQIPIGHLHDDILLQSNPVNTDTKGAIESVCINRVSILSEVNLEKMQRLSFPRDK